MRSCCIALGTMSNHLWWSTIMWEKRIYTYMCNWVTMLGSRKLTEHCKPAIMKKKKVLKKRDRDIGKMLWMGLQVLLYRKCPGEGKNKSWMSAHALLASLCAQGSVFAQLCCLFSNFLKGILWATCDIIYRTILFYTPLY